MEYDDEIFKEASIDDVPSHLKSKAQVLIDAHRAVVVPLPVLKRGKGRPKKDKEEKFSMFTLRLSPYYARIVETSRKGRGLSEAMRLLLHEHEILKAREGRQLKNVTAYSSGAYGLLLKCQEAKVAGNIAEIKRIEDELAKKARTLKTLLSMLGYLDAKYDPERRGERGEILKVHHDYVEDLLGGDELRDYKILRDWVG